MALFSFDKFDLVPDRLPITDVTVAAYAELTLGVVAVAFNMRPAFIRSNVRNPRVNAARRAVFYLMKTVFELRYTEIARAFDRDRDTVKEAIRAIEENREDPRFDQLLEASAASLATLPALLRTRRRMGYER